MRINQIVNYDFMNSDGIATTIVMQGCNREPKCEGCHSSHTWDINDGIEMSVKEIIDMIRFDIDDFLHDTIVIMGGEPLAQEDELFNLLYSINRYKIKIWLYTSYEINEIPERILYCCNVIKCGRYIKSLHSNTFPASSNQKIYNETEIREEMKRRG